MTCIGPDKAPDKASDKATRPAQLDLVRRATALLDEAAGETLTLNQLALKLAVSPWHLQRLFKRVTGVSPRDYADARRNLEAMLKQ